MEQVLESRRLRRQALIGKRPRGHDGFSLLEIMVVLFLGATLVGITAISLKHSTEREGSRGLAYAVASDLRAARAEAQRSGSLVAYCLSAGDPAKPHPNE